MAQWMGLAADWLRPIYEHIRTGVLGGGYVQVDETPIEYLAPGHGRTKLGYLWTCARPGGDTVFHWAVSRAATCLETIIPADFRGTLQADGYSAYPAFVRAHNARAGTSAITQAGCWAHARRAIYQAQESAPRTVGWLLRQIGGLYRIENAIRPTAIGKKNWLFIGEAEAGHRGAILYTLVESCRRRGIDPQAYLRDVLTRLPKMTTSQNPEVAPEAWNKARRQGHAPQAAA